MPIRILELRSVFGTGGGPEKTILHGAAQTDPARYVITVCYLRDRRDSVFAVNRRARALGIDYTEVVENGSLDPSVMSRLRAILRARQIDIVHAHDYKTNLLARLLARTDAVIPLTTLHGYTGDSWKERLYYAADRRLVKGFPRIITVSNDLTRQLLQVGVRRDKITTILNGIDHVTFRRDARRVTSARAALGVGPNDIVIGSVGRLESQKRFDLLLAAFADVRSKRTDLALKLVIAGSGSRRAALEAQRQALGIGDACIFTGQVEEVIDLHHALDLFVQSSDYEGTPNAVLEAMAMGTPTIATDAGGTAEVLRDRVEGLIVPVGQPAAIAAAIEQVLADPSGANARAAAGRRRVEGELSFATRLARVEQIYDELSEGRGGRSKAAQPEGSSYVEGPAG